MRSYDFNKMAIIHITTKVDEQRVHDCPPQIPYDNVDPDRVKDMVEETRRSAFGLDIYKDIIQVSILYQDQTWHVLYCDDLDMQLDQAQYPRVMMYRYEHELMGTACDLMNRIFAVNNMGATLAGWQLKVHVWPMFVCKAFKYNKHLSDVLLHDPSDNFDHGGSYRLDISNIYTQGVYSREKKIPAMSDVIREWTGVQLEPMEKLKESLCLDPVKAIEITDTYLRTMRDVVIRYKQLGELCVR